MKKNNSEFEYDSNEKAWEYYQKLYKNSFIEINENSKKLENSKKPENSRIIKIGKIKYKNKKKDNIKFSGDCFFNFNDEKILKFEKLVYGDKHSCELCTINIKSRGEACEPKNKKGRRETCETKSKKSRGEACEPKNEYCELMSLLSDCNKKHHSPENCILLPVSGGLNNVKGKTYIKEKRIKIHGVGRPPHNMYDRPDTFVCLIDDFYKNKNKINNIKSAGEYFTYSIFKESLISENFLALYETLDLFNNVYEFCECFFAIGGGEKLHNLINKMLKSGREEILCYGDLKKYIDLFYEFCDMRKSFQESLGI